MAEKEVGVAKFPERSRRVELYVVSNCFELAGVKRQLDIAVTSEDDGTDGDSRPRTPDNRAKVKPFFNSEPASRGDNIGGLNTGL